jgi:hypothetical protein
MKTKTLFLVLAALFSGCARRPAQPPVPREDDTSIALPSFLRQPAGEVGVEGQMYELDGAVMQALMIATNDYIPPDGEDPSCWGSLRAHRYRVIRQGDIIFVDIEEDLEACGLQYIMLHSGVTYAISLDGRILRRVAGSSPEAMSIPGLPNEDASPDAGVEAPASVPSPGTPPEAQVRDAGTPPSESPPAPATGPDGGS